MRKSDSDNGGAPPAVRRRERLQPARDRVLQVRLSDPEQDQIWAGAAAAGMTPSGFAARAALDAAAASVAPVGARTELERLAALQLEVAAVRRALDALRAALTQQTSAETPHLDGGAAVRRCDEAADELAQLSRAIHRRLGGGF